MLSSQEPRRRTGKRLPHSRSGTGVYLAAFNLSGKKRRIDLSGLGLPFRSARELWSGKAVKAPAVTLPAHDAAAWLLRKDEP